MANSHDYLHDEIVEMLADEIEMITAACRARVQCKPHLEQPDDDYEFLEETLDRWGDRKVPH